MMATTDEGRHLATLALAIKEIKLPQQRLVDDLDASPQLHRTGLDWTGLGARAGL